jgi:porin
MPLPLAIVTPVLACALGQAQAPSAPSPAETPPSGGGTHQGIRITLPDPAFGPPAPNDPDEAMKQDRPGLLDENGNPPPLGPGLHLFPKDQPTLMPYLASANLYGNSCLQSDALIMGDPLSLAAQKVKTELSLYGINYAVWQSYDFSAMSGTLPGKSSVLNYYSMNSYLTWNIFQTDDLSGSAGWITVGGTAGTGLGYDDSEQSTRTNMGVIGYPLGTDYGQGAYVYQLAWQQSFLNGQLVVTAGMIDPETYLDLNTFSNNPYNQLLNYEFINPATIPWSYNALGAVVEWQPVNWFYAMFASEANNTRIRQSPFVNVSSDNWTNSLELGLIGEDVLGLGRGVYRVMPFWGTHDGDSGAGFMVNCEQKLGKDGPFGAFLRTGFTNNALGQVQGARSSVAAGLVLSGKTESALMKYQQSYFGAGFYWLEAPGNAIANDNEYGLEFTYVVQLTETMTLQPDIQVILDPANNPTTGSNVMFTLQLTYTW